ncbi:MAG: prepilin peptidase [Candidatus Omnitrophica bacterium]|nr:prepilin peptidase [Candidatus Omnitrophota bacterium]
MLLKFIFFVLGAIVGSFLNVCIYRMPRSQSIIFPGSHCVNCQTPVKWHENIPLLSYLFLKGRCSACKAGIAPRYFVVEFLTALLFVLIYIKFGLGPDLLFSLLLVCGLIIAAFIDLEYQLIPDSISLGGLVVGLVSGLALHRFFDSLLGAVLGAFSIYGLGITGKLLFKKKLKAINEDSAMGLGDVKFMAMIGSFLGWKKVLLVFFLAPFFGAAAGIILKLKYKVEIIPYGPYLSLAAMVALIWGEKIINQVCFF